MHLHELTSRYEVGKVIDAMGLKFGAEIGVAFGENAEIILDTSSIDRLYLIDPWNYVPGEDAKGYADAIKDWNGCMSYCAEKVSRFHPRGPLVRKTSEEAAKGFPDGSLDFIYIDANHMRPMIDNDLKAWWPKLRDGGIFGGHDYHMVNSPYYVCQVKDAVDEFFQGKTLHITTKDSDPSWYVIK